MAMPYKLLVRWLDGRTTVQRQGHNPVEVHAGEREIARNGKGA